jgi:predicted dinucleotide-binding enzyme
MTPKQIGIIGKGAVGSALARGLAKAGHKATAVSDPGSIRKTVQEADLVILAVPFAAIDAVLKEAGETLAGKTVADATNALGPDMQWAIGFSTSGAEELQKKVPQAHVVKAFNTVFAQHMDSGQVDGRQLTALVAGDNPDAKKSVLGIARDIGFDAVDAGPLHNARLLEALGCLTIQLGYGLGMGTQIGFKLLHG